VRRVGTKSVTVVTIWRKLRIETFMEIWLVEAWPEGCRGALMSVEVNVDFLPVLCKKRWSTVCVAF
jgi:hypothetical protein